MDTLSVVIGLVFLLVVVVLFVFKPFDIGIRLPHLKKVGRAGARQDKSTVTKWRSVKIRPGLMCCKSAEGMADRIYLANVAPRFPLENCTEKECRCKYVFLDDRRSGGDRRVDFGKLGVIALNFLTERRNITERRTADLQA